MKINKRGYREKYRHRKLQEALKTEVYNSLYQM